MLDQFDMPVLKRLAFVYAQNKPLFIKFHESVCQDVFEINWTIEPLASDGTSFKAELAGVVLQMVFITTAPNATPAIEFWRIDRMMGSDPVSLGVVSFQPPDGLSSVRQKTGYERERSLSIIESDDAASLLARHFWMAWPKEKSAKLFA